MCLTASGPTADAGGGTPVADSLDPLKVSAALTVRPFANLVFSAAMRLAIWLVDRVEVHASVLADGRPVLTASPPSGEVWRSYYYSGGQRIAMRVQEGSGDEVFYLLADHLGSTTITADELGTFYSEMRYEPWGEVWYDSADYSGNATPTDFTYTGQRSNTDDFGLLFYNARWFDPHLGRFAQADTIVPGVGDPGAFDRYAAMRNNPVNYTDPSGHCPVCILIIAVLLLEGCSSQPPQSNVRPTSSSPLDSAVNITDLNGNHLALGTQISDDTVLTHNHQGLSLNQYSMQDAGGGNHNWQGAYSDAVGPNYISARNNQSMGQQTRLVTSNNLLNGAIAQLASQTTISNLQVGDFVDVVYWDDQNDQADVGQFEITHVGQGQLLISDPQGILNHGDSGGGAFYNGELIGNTWEVSSSTNDVSIALIPSTVTNNSKAGKLVQ